MCVKTNDLVISRSWRTFLSSPPSPSSLSSTCGEVTSTLTISMDSLSGSVPASSSSPSVCPGWAPADQPGPDAHRDHGPGSPGCHSQGGLPDTITTFAWQHCPRLECLGLHSVQLEGPEQVTLLPNTLPPLTTPTRCPVVSSLAFTYHHCLSCSGLTWSSTSPPPSLPPSYLHSLSAE